MPMKVIPPLYPVWQSMKQRCYNPNVKQFSDYGGRGISVCERWRTDFKAFENDMSPKPPGTSIDRINVDGDYTPSNCRWATRTTQQRNRRDSRKVVIEGVEHLVPHLAEKYGLKGGTIISRANKNLPFNDVVSPLSQFVMSDAHKQAIKAGQEAARKEQTHCKHGHEFTPDNTFISKEGWRRCRACSREKMQRHRDTGSYKRI